MTDREPSWWYGSKGEWISSALTPAAEAYGWIAAKRFQRTAATHAAHPVICVGNFTVGGTGKTPLALKLAELVRRQHVEPWFLSRGYGGRLKGPVRVDVGSHTAIDVGDEPLLLAANAPTVIARDRRQGAMLIAASAPANAVIIMDDGLQNPSLAKDLTIAVVDARRGVGNGRVLPAGPLRAPLAFQLSLADMIVVTGGRDIALDPSLEVALAFFTGTVIRAATIASGDTSWLKHRRILAYAGIANPNRFFSILDTLEARVVARRALGDHAPISERTATELLQAAATLNCDLVTTAKDMARLKGRGGAAGRLASQSRVLDIATTFNDYDEQQLTTRLQKELIAHRKRSP